MNTERTKALRRLDTAAADLLTVGMSLASREAQDRARRALEIQDGEIYLSMGLRSRRIVVNLVNHGGALELFTVDAA